MGLNDLETFIVFWLVYFLFMRIGKSLIKEKVKERTAIDAEMLKMGRYMIVWGLLFIIIPSLRLVSGVVFGTSLMIFLLSFPVRKMQKEEIAKWEAEQVCNDVR